MNCPTYDCKGQVNIDGFIGVVYALFYYRYNYLDQNGQPFADIVIVNVEILLTPPLLHPQI